MATAHVVSETSMVLLTPESEIWPCCVLSSYESLRESLKLSEPQFPLCKATVPTPSLPGPSVASPEVEGWKDHSNGLHTARAQKGGLLSPL